MSGELYDLALSVPWCITGEALEAMLSIAARDPLAEDEIARRMHGPKSLALRGGQRREDSGQMTMQGPVAVIPIDGPIYRYADIFTRMSGGVTTESLARDFQLALDDPSVRAVLFAIDSPGGEATGINELADAIYTARGTKPIVAHIEGYGASAAYWIASAADVITVDDSALVGSIGTILGVPDPTKRPSTRIDIVSRQSPKTRPDVTTEEGRAVLQQLADDMTEVFIAKVARNRGLDREQILAIEGGLLVGEQAVAAGLADTLGSEDRAIRRLALGALPQPHTQPRFAFKEVFAMGDSKGFWAGFWGGAKEAGIVPEATAEQPALQLQAVAAPLQPVQSKQADDERAATIAAENAELRKQLAAARAERMQSDAAAFVKEQLGAGHIYPAETQAVLALYVRAAELDATAPRDDGQPSCVALVKAAYAERPAHDMTRSRIPTLPKGTVLANGGDDEEQAELARAEQSARQYGERMNGKR